MNPKSKTKTSPKPQNKTETKKAKAAAQPPTTMAELAERYIAHLEDAGKSAGTTRSYGQDLQTAVTHFGPQTDINALTAAKVAAYFEADVVMKKRSGKPKAKPTFLKTQRVLRLALVWAAEAGLIENAPIPKPSAKS